MHKPLHWDQVFKKEFVKANSCLQPQWAAPSAHRPTGVLATSSPNPTRSTASSPHGNSPVPYGDGCAMRKQIDSPGPSLQACVVCISPVKWDGHQAPLPSQGLGPQCEWEESEVY